MYERILKAVHHLCIMNFLAFGIISLIIGGEANFGHIENGHYFISLHSDSRQVEVGESVYNYSYIHFYSQFITLPLGMYTGYLARDSQYNLEYYARPIIDHPYAIRIVDFLDEKKLNYIWYLIIANLAIFMIISKLIGGSAYFGGIESGRYFIAPYQGAQMIEVSHFVYVCKYLHSIVTLSTLPIAVCSALLLRYHRR